MIKKIFFGLLLIAVLVISILQFSPMPLQNNDSLSNNPSKQFLPWQIEITEQGNTRVFGLTLSESTLQDAEAKFRGGAKVSMFASPSGEYKIEAYFDKVIMAGLSAKFVLVMALDQTQQETMFQRGARMSNLGDGRKKISLSGADLQTVFASPIASIAYLTRTRLDNELLLKRFGEPAQRIRESETDTTHWLYPKQGLDIAFNEKGRAVLQYVSPKEFNRLIEPLLIQKNP